MAGGRQPTMADMLKMAKVIGYGNTAKLVYSQLQRMFDKSFAGRHRYKLMFLASSIMWYRNNQAKAARRRKKERERRAKGLPKPAKDPKKNGINAMWSLLWPEVPFAGGDDGAGSWEIAAMMSLCLLRIGLMNGVSYLVGRLDNNMMTRNQPEFWYLWRRVLGLAMLTAVHRNTYKYTEERLATVWKEKLTNAVHKLYFKDMAYYEVAQVAAVKGTMQDTDDRITEDIKKVSTEMAHVLCEGMYASTAGVFFAWRLGKLYGMRYALGPYVYLWSTFVITSKLAPVNWSKVMGKMREAFAQYRGSVSRLFVHQEAIAAMKGSEVERSLVQSRFQALVARVEEYDITAAWHGFVNQLGFAHWLRAFVALFVIGPHVFVPSVTDLSTVANVAELRGTIGHEFVMFIQSMIAAGLTAQMGKQLQKVAGSAGRLNELFVALRQLAINRRMTKRVDAIDGTVIEFKDVRVATPTGNVLVEKLNFKLEKGSSLLLTGHNGAGKSSIFRCLGGLWPVTQGTIVKPGGAESGLHQKVFFLPQKPYQVLGTLQEQLTYPAKQGNIRMTKAELVDILKQVDLAYLADREDVMTKAVHWEEELSLGEKQRLAMARLIFHKPDYAILDECTSAVSGTMERRLYDVCKRNNITYITISHRPVLRAFHDRILTIGLGDQGYTLEDITHDANPDVGVNTSLARVHHADSDESDPAPAAPAPAARPLAMPTQRVARPLAPPTTTLQCLVRLVSLSLTRSSGITAGGIVGAVLAQGVVVLRLMQLGGDMMGAVFTQDKRGYLGLLFRAFVYQGVNAFLEQVILFLQRRLDLDMRVGLANNFEKRLFRNNNFYKLVQFDGGVKDPEQRIADDVRDLANTTSRLFTELLKPVVDLGLFAGKISTLVGLSATSGLLGYLLVGAAVIRMTLPNYRSIVAREKEEEGKFKNIHARVRTHAEPIAFFGGDDREHEVARTQFARVIQVQMERLRVNWKFGCVSYVLVREAPMLVQWLLRNAHGQTFADASIEADQGASLNQGQIVIYETVLSCFTSMSRLLDFAEHFSNLSGLIHRVAELDTAITNCEHMDIGTNKRATGVRSDNQNTITFDGVDIETPSGQLLAKDLTVAVQEGAPLMVTGPNAAGKTSFFRVLGGLWPVNKGQVTSPHGRDGRPDIDQVFLVPQRIYMATGSLAFQITYPKQVEVTPEVAEQLQHLLDLVGIGYLSGRDGGWQTEMTWEDVLSLGEQQRIGMARLFFHHPKFGVLDECTSAVSVEVEERLYQEAMQRQITCITLSQRLALHEHHTHELRLGDTSNGGWSLHDVAQV